MPLSLPHAPGTRPSHPPKGDPKGCDKHEKREKHHDHCKPRKPKHCKHHHRPKHKGCR
jgi:hypothetical protein